MSTPAFIVYTDGSCWTGDRIGAYSWICINEDDDEYCGGSWEADTTISRMELRGPIEALDAIYSSFGSSVILIYSDSEYVVLGATDQSRKRNKNVDLWDTLDAFVSLHEYVGFEHVKGHDGAKYNELADKLAGDLRAKGQDAHTNPQSL